ncbi:uncharacterized protein LOC129568505 [Sitodiplosis mosellana]|uniref:uncharacterized protein LOC129568505 n=1 Tax=Sitodiplosis mosellana TaxID=263140 RepID=UPI002444EC6E|nr:uncharacterized protein LOC129568505 [Sitodiplosis mosellana]
MTSTSFNVGMSSDRSSSRVLKPPGGGHTSIFGESEVKVNSPRPKYDQQNSSNLNFCMNTTDANVLVEQVKHEIEPKPAEAKPATPVAPPNSIQFSDSAEQASLPNRGSRVPPGGFSSGGFW